MKTNKPRESKRFDEHKYQLHSLEEGMQFMFSYIYDAGEGWEHVIHLEEVVPPERELPHPFLLAGEHSCPPEEVGDVHEYNRLVTAFVTPDSSERHSLAEFSENPEFDPAVFNFEEAKRLVSKI
jgi:hypothetical protein